MIRKIINFQTSSSKSIQKSKTLLFDLKGVLLCKKIDEPSKENSLLSVVNFTETIALLKTCKAAGHKLFVLSNLSIETYETIKQEPEIASLFSFFDDIIISEMTPYEKPNPEIFTYFCEQYNIQPIDCIFIDDKQENLYGAQAAHINKTILCSNFDIDHIKNELVKYGILQHHEMIELNIPTGQA